MDAEREVEVLEHTREAVSAGQILTSTHLSIGLRYHGKVRDVYTAGNRVAIVTTDRLSAFDRTLCCVPFKGAVLSLTSQWWFQQTAHIVPNHVLATPHPNVMVVRKAVPFRVEFVVRAYLTGSTSTSIWQHYSAGAREYCGHKLPDGMVKNQPLPYVMVTPTTKEEVHDRPISAGEIVSSGLMSQEEWDYVSAKALEVFAFGQEEAAKRGLILVDTKYEFGRDALTGKILLVDEVHTPDSSRYWLAASYEERLAAGAEPENIDKEFLRIWFRKNCDPYADAVLPSAPAGLVAELSKRYVQLYEIITGQRFPFPESLEAPSSSSITDSLKTWFVPSPRCALVLKTAIEGTPAEELAAAVVKVKDAADGPTETRLAVEVMYANAVDKPAELLELARKHKERKTAVAVVVGGGDVAATAAAFARHSTRPTVAIGAPAETTTPAPVVFAANNDAAVSFCKAL